MAAEGVRDALIENRSEDVLGEWPEAGSRGINVGLPPAEDERLLVRRDDHAQSIG